MDASMRPRSISRGNGEVAVRVTDLGNASMRPRSISRGNPVKAAGHPLRSLGFNEAPIN